MEDKVKLKACPFCGAEPTMEVFGGPGSLYRTVQCKKCKCDLHFYPLESVAIAAWNTRAPDTDYSRLQSLAEGMAKALREVRDDDGLQCIIQGVGEGDPPFMDTLRAALKAFEEGVTETSAEYRRGFEACREQALRIVDEHDGFLSRIAALKAYEESGL